MPINLATFKSMATLTIMTTSRIFASATTMMDKI